ncbi:MAG: BatD family protein [Bacteroidia bacterium]
MNKVNKIAVLVIGAMILLMPCISLAQKLTAQVSKNKVYVGEVFQISFTANGNMGGFKQPNMPDFDIYSGPNQSTSVQIMNGNMSQTISYSFMIGARKEGKYTIGPASATVNNVKVESNSVTIEVMKGSAPQQQQRQQQQQNDPFAQFFGNDPNQQQQQQQSAPEVNGEDIFVRTYVNKKQCYLGEQITVTQKVYSRLNLRGFQNFKAPTYDGFWSKDEERKGQIQLNVENVDGINYYVAEFMKTYLFPQRTGKLTISPIEIDCIVRQQTRKQQSVFDQFFGGGYQDVVAKIKSKQIVVDVMPLPEKGKPEGFSGAVGKFTFKAEMNHKTVKANEGINLKVTVSGTGNINLAETPKINFPEGFESYEPKVNENISTQGGISGSKTYDYLVIPRKEGEYVIKDLSFSYFDLEKKQYVQIPSPEFKITVTPGDANSESAAKVYNPRNEVDVQENDIRYIKSGDLKLKAVDEEFFGSWKHYSLLLLALVLFGGGLTTRNYLIKSNSNLVAVRERKAARLAKKQLARAEQLKNQNKQDEFYNEVHAALNLYVSHKMNIPVADLSKENITATLAGKNVKQETINKLISTLNDCEYARYAPSAAEKDLNLVYNNTVELITNIEDEAG